MRNLLVSFMLLVNKEQSYLKESIAYILNRSCIILNIKTPMMSQKVIQETVCSFIRIHV